MLIVDNILLSSFKARLGIDPSGFDGKDSLFLPQTVLIQVKLRSGVAILKRQMPIYASTTKFAAQWLRLLGCQYEN